ncbi:MAG: hypothetical protein M3N43_00690 [Actinomycetota bacterium]|nr:hypothetical protein [Actinomycetota bacterium]
MIDADRRQQQTALDDSPDGLGDPAKAHATQPFSAAESDRELSPLNLTA